MSEEKKIANIGDGDPLPKTIAEIDVKQHLEEWDTWKAEMATRVANNNELFADIGELAALKHNMWKVRTDLVNKKFELMTTSNKIGRVLKHFRKKVSETYRFQQQHFGFSKPGIILKNKEEREIYQESDLRAIEWFSDTIDVELNWVRDQIDTTDKAMFAIGHVLTLEEKYKKSV